MRSLLASSIVAIRFFTGCCPVLLGSLSNDESDGNENGKKAIGLDWQNNNFAHASRFFVHF